MSAGCVCCGTLLDRAVSREVRRQWQGRMDGFCYDCAIARCDAFPGECPVVARRHGLPERRDEETIEL